MQELEHPVEVAQIGRSACDDDEVIAAALLHDTVEDGLLEFAEIDGHFGRRVAELVEALTEDGSIEDYEERKAEHRERVVSAGRDVALIFAADKLANARAMLEGRKRADGRKLHHYEKTAELLRERYSDLTVLPALERALAELATSINSR
jgi:(p)ppGpp synthase/HD superfamily hydrolase